ncbi:hypothetical protein ACVRXF_10500 [Streptococcus orisasini]
MWYWIGWIITVVVSVWIGAGRNIKAWFKRQNDDNETGFKKGGSNDHTQD